MARPDNIGLEYFSLDTGYFDSLDLMTVYELHGMAGELTTLKLTSLIYRNGYAIKWDDMTAKMFARRVMLDPEVPVKEIVASLLEIGYLDKETYQRTGMLTSRGIQKRWQLARKACKKPDTIEPALDLLSERTVPASSGNFRENSGNLPETSGDPSGNFRENSGNLPETSGDPSGNFRENSGNLPETSGDPSGNFRENSGNLPENSRTRKEIKRKDINTNTPPTPPEGVSVVEAALRAYEEDGLASERAGELAAAASEVIQAWNDVFGETARKANPVNEPLNVFFRGNLARARDDGITLDQFRAAFLWLSDQPEKNWQIHSAVKPENVKLLLTESENSKRAKARSGPNRTMYEVTGKEQYAANFF